MIRTLANSPSAGVDEVLRALRRARGYPGRNVPAARLKRYLPFRVPLADIVDVLAAQVTAAHVATDGAGNYSLTTTGAAFSRANQPRRYPLWVA